MNSKLLSIKLLIAYLTLILASSAFGQTATHETYVPNGSFEDVSAFEPSLPAAWEFTDNPGIRLSSDNPHSGSMSLRIETGQADDSIQMSESIPVEAGQQYRIRSHYRVQAFDGTDKGRFYLQALYQDANGDPIEHRVCRNDFTIDCQSNDDCQNGSSCHVRQPNEQLITSNNLKATADWRQHERTLRPKTYLDAHTGEPVDAASMVLRFVKNSTFAGTISFDDISVKPIVTASLAPLPVGSVAYDIVPALCSAQSANAGQSCQVDSDCGEGVCGQASEGFTPLHFEQTFSSVADQGCGFEKPAKHRNQGSPYPHPMLGQSVKWSTIQCRADANQDYVVSVYIGGYWMNGGDTELHRIEVNDERTPRVDESQTCTDDGCTQVDLLDTVHFAHVEATLVNNDLLDKKGYAIYDEYIWPRRYRRHDLSIRSDASGELKLEINGYVSGLVLSPAHEAETVSTKLKTFETEMRHAFVNQWATYVEPETLGIPQVSGDYLASGAEQDRGYVLFQRHWMQEVGFSSRPNSEDVIDDPEKSPLQITATPGEYEPVTFSIWPLEKLHGVTLEASDLVSDSGGRIPSAAVRTWFLQHRPHRLNPPTRYTIVPGFLPDWNVRDLDPNITQRAWLNVHVPKDAESGTYRGTVQLSGDGLEPTTLPLEIVVLPFELVRPERVHVMRRSPGNPVHLPGDRQLQTARAFEDLWNHGFTPEISIWWPSRFQDDNRNLRRDSEGNVILTWGNDKLSETLRLLKEHYLEDTNSAPTLWLDAASIKDVGIFSGTSNGGSNDWKPNDTKSWLKAVEDRFGPAGAGFEKIYLHASAEESHYRESGNKLGASWHAWLDFFSDVRFSREDNGSPHVFSVHTFNTAEGQAAGLDRDVDLPAIGMFHGIQGSAKTQIDQARSRENPFLFYGLQGRMVPGFYLWKAGANGSFNEFYGRFEGALNNDWDSRVRLNSRGLATAGLSESPGLSSAVYSNSGRMIGSWYWEEIREGVDDDAYMNTLQHWIDRTESDNRLNVMTAREAALATLAFIESEIDLDEIGQLDSEKAAADRKLLHRHGLKLLRPFDDGVHSFDSLRREAAIAIGQLVIASRSGAERHAISLPRQETQNPQNAGYRALSQLPIDQSLLDHIRSLQNDDNDTRNSPPVESEVAAITPRASEEPHTTTISDQEMRNLQNAGHRALAQIRIDPSVLDQIRRGQNGNSPPVTTEAATSANKAAPTLALRTNPSQPKSAGVSNPTLGTNLTDQDVQSEQSQSAAAIQAVTTFNTLETPAADVESDEEPESLETPEYPANARTVHVPEPSSDGLAITMLIALVILAGSRRRNARQ